MIIEQLRADQLPDDRQYQREARIVLRKLLDDAAAEIDHLRAEVERLMRELDWHKALTQSHDLIADNNALKARAEAAADEIECLRAEVDRLMRERDEAWKSAENQLRLANEAVIARRAAERKVVKLRESLREAIDLRIKLYRNGDLLGDDDHLSDKQIATKETYARKWSAALAETEKK